MVAGGDEAVDLRRGEVGVRKVAVARGEVRGRMAWWVGRKVGGG